MKRHKSTHRLGMEQMECRAMFAGLVHMDFSATATEAETAPTREIPPDEVEQAAISTGLDEVVFNPQPEPPKTVQIEMENLDSGLSQVAFNPQPEPPSDTVFARFYR